MKIHEHTDTELFITMLKGVIMFGWMLISLAVANYMSSPELDPLYSHLPIFKLSVSCWTVSSLSLIPRSLWMVIVPENVPPPGVFTWAATRVSVASGLLTLFPLVLRWAFNAIS